MKHGFWLWHMQEPNAILETVMSYLAQGMWHILKLNVNVNEIS